ncbi:MAG: dihydrofolate reductase [Lachnospiraceae bacterium]|nr:dihydrofolate reductase [Lachnospiraceae bacterium]
MKSIVNVNEKWGIGRKGGLLCYLRPDMKFFSAETKGKIVVYGLNTLKSFPGMKPLKGRINVVLAEALDMIPMESIKACDCYIDDVSTGSDIQFFGMDGATSLIACTSLPELLDILALFNGDDIYVCGGASVYALMLPYCDTCLVTKNSCTDEADVFYPNLDEMPDWECVCEGEDNEYEGIHYRFTTYKRKEEE